MTDANEIPSPESHEQESARTFADFVMAHVPEQSNDGAYRIASYSYHGSDQLLPINSIDFEYGPSIDSPDYDQEAETGSVQGSSISIKNPVENYDIRYNEVKGFTMYIPERGVIEPISPETALSVVAVLRKADEQGNLPPAGPAIDRPRPIQDDL